MKHHISTHLFGHVTFCVLQSDTVWKQEAVNHAERVGGFAAIRWPHWGTTAAHSNQTLYTITQKHHSHHKSICQSVQPRSSERHSQSNDPPPQLHTQQEVCRTHSQTFVFIIFTTCTKFKNTFTLQACDCWKKAEPNQPGQVPVKVFNQ